MTDEVKNRIKSDVRSKFYNIVANEIGYDILDKNNIPIKEQKEMLQDAFDWFMEKFFDE